MNRIALVSLALAACGENTTTGPDAAAPPVEHVAIVEGNLLDPATAQAHHDMGARAAQPIADAAGDLAHIVGLGASVLGTKPDRLTILDRWSKADNITAFYGDAAFQSDINALVSSPSVTQYRRETTWYGWGDYDAGAGAPRWYVLVRGRLHDPANAQTGADMGAMAAQPTATSLGDVAHLAFRGRDDDAAFLAIDVWTRPDAIEQFYTGLVQQAAALFDGAPTITVLHATDWYQWGSSGKTTLDGKWKITSYQCNAQSIPVGDFELEVRAGQGRFVQVFDPQCVATYDESYAYAAATSFEITAHSITCDPSSSCQSVLGASCLPTPPPTAFDWTLTGDQLVFTRTATGPGDAPCQAGDKVTFTMQRQAL